MPDRVLATHAARERISHARGVIDGPFMDQITALAQDFSVLKDRNQWDGSLADQYRPLMEDVERALKTAQGKLVEFARNMGTINANILTAGGEAA